MKRNLRIAVADDEAFIRRYFREILPDLGHQVVGAASDGAELIQLCREQQPDLVISDIRMPNVDGIDAALAIFDHRPTPIILVSAFHDEDLIRRAESSQAMAYLTKPIEKKDLETTIPITRHNFERAQALEAELAALRRTLEERKTIEIAKGLLMKVLKLDEPEAYRAMQRIACEKNRKLIDVAKLVIQTHGPVNS